jgi:hypothetical protein
MRGQIQIRGGRRTDRTKCRTALRYIREHDIPEGAVIQIMPLGPVRWIGGCTEVYAVARGNLIILNEKHLAGLDEENLACKLRHEFEHVRTQIDDPALDEQLAYEAEAEFARRCGDTSTDSLVRMAFRWAETYAREQAEKWARAR